MSGCIETTAGRDRDGYGRKWVDGKSRLTHRLSYVEAHKLDLGDIDGLVVMHTCDNPPCVNPDHLALGTRRNNVDDMTAKGRQGRGETQGFSKLTEADVIDIRASTKKQAHLAKKYGVVHQCISSIKTYRTWKHVA